MAKVIWKYPIPDEAEFKIEMPKGAYILKVASQQVAPYETRLMMWVLVDDAAEKETRKFSIIGTGQSVEKMGEYIDTFLVMSDKIVLHLFEITG
jgi:hypothetical protein